MSFTLEACYATLPRTRRDQHIVIGGDPKRKNFLYTNGTSVIIRNIEDPSIADVYAGHNRETTVAKYSPNGLYIASGDISGKVRIWDAVDKEHILKYEYQPLSGRICDLAWSSDSKRIVAVGEGRGEYGAVFLWDSGSSVGEISGMCKSINGCDYKQTRPFRIAAASEDYSLTFFEGPPFEYKTTIDEHTNFVNTVRYAPDGSVFISGGADGRAFIFDGKTGERRGELGLPSTAHRGGINAISFSPDSKEVLTASADKTCKIFNLDSYENPQCVVVFPMGRNLEDMQVGCLWQVDYLISVSLSGHINYLDRDNPSQPSRIIKGHNKAITALALTEDRSSAFTGNIEGQILKWDINNGQCEEMKGDWGHLNEIQDLQIKDGVLTSVSLDETLRLATVESAQYNSDPVVLESQPRKVSVGPEGLSVVACLKQVYVLRDGEKVFTLKVDYETLSVAIHPRLTEVYVGTDRGIRVYNLDGDTLSESETMSKYLGERVLKFSPNGEYLATADNKNQVGIYKMDPDSKYPLWGKRHAAKVNTIAWAPDSSKLASVSLDSSIVIWNSEDLGDSITIREAHGPRTDITGVAWLDDNTLISVGRQDCCIKKWKIHL